jgi:hypothetical protein
MPFRHVPSGSNPLLPANGSEVVFTLSLGHESRKPFH